MKLIRPPKKYVFKNKWKESSLPYVFIDPVTGREYFVRRNKHGFTAAAKSLEYVDMKLREDAIGRIQDLSLLMKRVGHAFIMTYTADNTKVPHFTGNLGDSIGFAEYLGGRLMDDFSRDPIATKAQRWGSKTGGDLPFGQGFGADYVVDANSATIKRQLAPPSDEDDYINLTAVLSAGIPYAAITNDIGTPGNSGYEGWFTRLVEDFGFHVKQLHVSFFRGCKDMTGDLGSKMSQAYIELPYNQNS